MHRQEAEESPNLLIQAQGLEKQFEFNEEVKDWLEAASSHIAKLPKEMQEIPSLKSATEELREGIKALLTCQKLIWLADHSDLGWAAVNTYESDESVSDNEDAKHIKEAKKAANQKEQKEKKQTASQRGGRTSGSGWRGQPLWCLSNPAPAVPRAYGVLMASMANGAMRSRQVGPCINCLEMRHLKVHCTKRAKPYPLNQLDNLRVKNSVDNIVCDTNRVYSNCYSYMFNGSQTVGECVFSGG